MDLALLVDPGIALIPSSTDIGTAGPSWELFVKWQSDSRSRLGVETYLRLVTTYQGITNGTHDVPGPLRQSAFRSVGVMLSRGPLGEFVENIGYLTPRYLGDPNNAEAIRQDLISVGSGLVAVGTTEAHWPGAASAVSHVPAPPTSVALHFNPHQPSVDEVIAAQHALFAGCELIIVGGQAESRVVEKIESDLGIDRSRIRWIPCEVHKKPRNLDSVVHGASQTGAVVICITGRVGHATSGELSASARRHSTTYLEVHTPNTIVPSLMAHRGA